MTVSPDLVVVLSGQSEEQLGQVRELLASFIAELGERENEKNCPLCGERQEGELGPHLINHHSYSQKETTFFQQLGLLPPDRLRQLVMVLDTKGLRQRTKQTEYIEDIIKEEPTENHKCRTCEFQTIHPGNLTKHERRHSGVHQCNHCESLFDEKKILTKHILRQHRGLEKEYACIECGKKFLTKTLLKRHCKVHLKVESKPFQCEFCSYATDTKRNLDLHHKTHQNTTVDCQICGKKLNSDLSLKNHLKQFHSGREKKCDCKECGKVFMTPFELKAHSIIHQENRPKPFDCDICEFKTDKKRNLELHKRTHCDTRVTCSFCNQEFSSPDSLSLHTWRISLIISNAIFVITKHGLEENLEDTLITLMLITPCNVTYVIPN